MRTLSVFLAAASLAFGQAKLPQYTKETLPNGAVIAMMPRVGVPLVHFRVLIKGGVESDPPEMAGLGSVSVQAYCGAGRPSARRSSSPKISTFWAAHSEAGVADAEGPAEEDSNRRRRFRRNS